ncbi:NIF3-like protein 1 isoform X3 [Pieris brassicae]|uniref:NIF3-like protein 1 isoform X3 n=1 Tax=Pieris brassicae TaxID=7116 RepID=UPI001E66025D|nr:NIF3-like protein 1 isoform X3 [Pieris brassicae]
MFKISRFSYKTLQLQKYCTIAKLTSGNMSNITIHQVLATLEEFAPKSLSESWDNTGVLVEPYTPRNIKKILLTNDLTEDVALEADNQDCEMIISYHPPIFAPMKSVKQRFLRLEKSISVSNAVTRVKELTGLQYVRLALARSKAMNEETLQTIALCAGSGASVLKNVSADLFLTGEMLHHDVLDATQKGISVILTNHSDSERGFLKDFSTCLQNELSNNVEVIVSKCDKDPLTTV